MIGRYLFIRDARLTAATKLWLALAVVLALVVLLPLRLVLGSLADEDGPLSARAAQGIVWDGRVIDARVGSLPLGTLDVALMPWSLLSGGTFSVEREASPGRAGFAAKLGGDADSLRIGDANGELDLAGAMGALPVRAISFAEFAMDMDHGRCIEASGNLGLVIASLGPLIEGETVLAGEARCEDGVLTVPMVGPTGTERLLFTVNGSEWSADLHLSNLPVEVAAPLLERGFTGRPNGIGFTASGSF